MTQDGHADTGSATPHRGGLLELRRRQQALMTSILRAVVFLGPPTLIAGSVQALRLGEGWRILVYVPVYAAVAVATLWSRSTYSVQAWTLVSLGWLVGVVELQVEGLSSSGRVFLVLAAVLAALVLKRRAAWSFLGVVAATMVIYAWLFTSGRIVVPEERLVNSIQPDQWLVASVTFLTLTGILVAAQTGLVRSLAETAQRNRRLVAELAATERRNAELAALQRTVLDTVAEGVLAVDERGTVTLENRSLRTLWGNVDEDLVGQSAERVRELGLRQITEPAPLEEVIRATWEDPSLETVVLVEHLDGRFLEAETRPGSGAGAARVWTFRDVTFSQRAIQQLEQLNHELEQRAAARTAELEAANQELEAFSYSASHDLRAPLRPLNGFSHLLLEDETSSLSPTSRAALERILASSLRMEGMIDALLGLIRITRSEVRRESLDLAALADEIQAEQRAAAPDRPVALQAAPGLKVRADRKLVRLLLRALLRHAWRSVGDVPDVHLEAVEGASDGVRSFQLRFAGRQSAAEVEARLAQPFSLLQAVAELEHGGIGLSSARRIAERHGGWLTVSATPEGDVAFRFALDGGPGAAPGRSSDPGT